MEKGAQNRKDAFKKKVMERQEWLFFSPKSASMKHIFFAVKFALNGYLTELWLKKEAPLHGRL